MTTCSKVNGSWKCQKVAGHAGRHGTMLHPTPCADVENGLGCEQCDAFENEAAIASGHEEGCDYTAGATMPERLEHYRIARVAPKGTVHRDGDHRLSAEASDIRFPVGQWPEEVEVGGVVFVLSSLHRNVDGDVRLGRYVRRGEVLNVYND